MNYDKIEKRYADKFFNSDKKVCPFCGGQNLEVDTNGKAECYSCPCGASWLDNDGTFDAYDTMIELAQGKNRDIVIQSILDDLQERPDEYVFELLQKLTDRKFAEERLFSRDF